MKPRLLLLFIIVIIGITRGDSECSEGSVLHHDTCVCRLKWICQGEACEHLSLLHIETTGVVLKRIGYPKSCQDCFCERPPHAQLHLHYEELLEPQYSQHAVDILGSANRPSLTEQDCLTLNLGKTRCEAMVFGIGYSKTGDDLLAEFLKELKLEIAHNPFDMLKPIASWDNEAYKTYQVLDYSNLDAIDGATGIPVATLFDELAERYPRAKFIFTERSLKEWISEMSKIENFHTDEESIARRNAYGTDYPLKPFLLQEYAVRQYRMVSNHIDPGRLLIVNILESHDLDLIAKEICDFVDFNGDCPSFPAISVSPPIKQKLEELLESNQ